MGELAILKSLKVRLRGKCSTGNSTCPAQISYGSWICTDCVKLFEGIADLRKLRDEQVILEGVNLNPCPCCISQAFPEELPPEVVIARVDERINELEGL